MNTPFSTPGVSSPQQNLNLHRLLQGQNIPFEPPDPNTSSGVVYLLSAQQGIVFKAASQSPSALAAAAREQVIYSLIHSGLIKIPQTLTHYLSFPHHGTFTSYMPNGTLYARLINSTPNPAIHPHGFLGGPTIPQLPPNQIRQRLCWVLQIARLARAFACRDLDHGAWHPKNLLLDANLSVCVCDFKSVVQFGTRAWAPTEPNWGYNLTAAEEAGEGNGEFARDQAWWLHARSFWKDDAFPREFGLVEPLGSLRDDEERSCSMLATERRTCFALACVLYFVMTGEEPHPVLFQQKRAYHEIPWPAGTQNALGPLSAPRIMRDPEDESLEGFGRLGWIVRRCWEGKVASVVVFFAMVMDVCSRYCNDLGWNRNMMEDWVGKNVDDAVVIDLAEWQKKRKLCEQFVDDWKRGGAHGKG